MSEPIVNVNGDNVAGMLERATHYIRAQYVINIGAQFSSEAKFSAGVAALRQRFANGRGLVSVEQRPDLFPGIAVICVDHTDIGSDSENDPRIEGDCHSSGDET